MRTDTTSLDVNEKRCPVFSSKMRKRQAIFSHLCEKTTCLFKPNEKRHEKGEKTSYCKLLLCDGCVMHIIIIIIISQPARQSNSNIARIYYLASLENKDNQPLEEISRDGDVVGSIRTKLCVCDKIQS